MNIIKNLLYCKKRIIINKLLKINYNKIILKNFPNNNNFLIRKINNYSNKIIINYKNKTKMKSLVNMELNIIYYMMDFFLILFYN
jgi:hypothetical protein